MCGRPYYIDGHRYFGSYPRGHHFTKRPESYGRRIEAASPSPGVKREGTPEMKRESSPSPEPKVKTEPSSPRPLPPAPIQGLSPPARSLKRRLSIPSSPLGDLQPPATKKLKQDSGDVKSLRARSLTPWSPIPDDLHASLEEQNAKLKFDIKDLRTEMIIQEHLNEALKEENAAAAAYTKKLEEQVRWLKRNVRRLREQLRGLTGELERKRWERGEKAEKKRVERRRMDAFWDGRVSD